MAQQTEPGATPQPTAPMRPGKTDGQAREFTIILPLKPGGAEMVREVLKQRESSDEARRSPDAVGTLHDMRAVIFDNDSRLLFATTFDGDWDSYINDFSTGMPDQLDALFEGAEGYPGIRSPEIVDYILKYQIEADMFYSAYPQTTVNQIKKGQRVLKAWEELLDASEE